MTMHYENVGPVDERPLSEPRFRRYCVGSFFGGQVYARVADFYRRNILKDKLWVGVLCVDGGVEWIEEGGFFPPGILVLKPRSRVATRLAALARLKAVVEAEYSPMAQPDKATRDLVFDCVEPLTKLAYQLGAIGGVKIINWNLPDGFTCRLSNVDEES